MIISFSGRKLAGKTTLLKELLKIKFIQVSFADYLKQKVSELYNWELEDLYSTNGKEEKLKIPVIFDNDKSQELAKICNLNRIVYFQNVVFHTRREALQYIGTEILRKYDKDFHVKKTKEKIQSLLRENKNIVLDDCRFCNEKEILNELKAIQIFIIRPNNFQYSNHSSETELNRSMFEYLIMNDCSLQQFVNKFNRFFKHLISKQDSIISREFLLKNIINYKSTQILASKIKCSRDKIVWWCKNHLVDIPHTKYRYNHNVFSNANKEAAYWAGVISGDGCIKKSGKSQYKMVLELSSTDKCLIDAFIDFVDTNKKPYTKIKSVNHKNNYYITINSPYIIEDMKLWCIEPRKSKYNKIPDIIKDNDNLLKYWIMGLIDSDGTIYFCNNNIFLSVLASKDVIEFIVRKFNINTKIRQHKKHIENLYDFCLSGKKAIAFYNQIYDPKFGLDRKWNKFSQFIEEKKSQ